MLITLISTGCQTGTIKYESDYSIIYNNANYYYMNDGFEYIFNDQNENIGYLQNYYMSKVYVYISKNNDDIIYAGSSDSRDSFQSSDLWLKDGYKLPDNSTIISSIYISSYFNNVKHNLEIDNQSFNDLFIEVAFEDFKNKDIKFVSTDGFECLYISYEGFGQTILKHIDSLYEDVYGNIYFKIVVNNVII